MYPDALVQKIGQISLTPDWQDLLKSGGTIWVSCSCQDEKTLYGEINVKRRPEGLQLESSIGFEANLLGKKILQVKCIDRNVTSYIFSPDNTFSNIHDKGVRCLDVSPGGGLAVSCGDGDGGLYVWQTDNGNLRRTLEGHISDVSQCRFFPSGVVVISGGTDMRLRIWSVEDGSCPVTLIGHTGGITGTAIVDRGRNVISCSRDGSARLWDCGTAQCLWKVENSSTVLNCCSISQYQNENNEVTMVQNSDRECGTEGKIVLLGHENGSFEGVDLFSKCKIFSLPCHAAINGCSFVDENNMAVGLQDGKIVYFDVRNTRVPQQVWKYGKASINCLQRFHGDSTLIGRGDGSCSCIRNFMTPEIVTMELSGPDCDPLFDVKCHGNFVYTTCRDSCVRKYKLDLNT